jgi:hypothetical protein
VYRDIQDLNNKIIRREYPLKNQNKLTVHEFYENNTSLIKNIPLVLFLMMKICLKRKMENIVNIIRMEK